MWADASTMSIAIAARDGTDLTLFPRYHCYHGAAIEVTVLHPAMRMETAATITSTTASMVMAGTAEAQKSMVIPLLSATFRCLVSLVDLIARCRYPESEIRMCNLLSLEGHSGFIWYYTAWNLLQDGVMMAMMPTETMQMETRVMARTKWITIPWCKTTKIWIYLYTLNYIYLLLSPHRNKKPCLPQPMFGSAGWRLRRRKWLWRWRCFPLSSLPLSPPPLPQQLPWRRGRWPRWWLFRLPGRIFETWSINLRSMIISSPSYIRISQIGTPKSTDTILNHGFCQCFCGGINLGKGLLGRILGAFDGRTATVTGVQGDSMSLALGAKTTPRRQGPLSKF